MLDGKYEGEKEKSVQCKEAMECQVRGRVCCWAEQPQWDGGTLEEASRRRGSEPHEWVSREEQSTQRREAVQ